MRAAECAAASRLPVRVPRLLGEQGQTFPFAVVTIFALFIIAGVVINVGQEYGLAAKLSIGELAETIQVTAGELLVKTTTPEVSATVQQQQVLSIPLAIAVKRRGSVRWGLISTPAGRNRLAWDESDVGLAFVSTWAVPFPAWYESKASATSPPDSPK